jgi:deoxyribose-phosphate aldolase
MTVRYVVTLGWSTGFIPKYRTAEGVKSAGGIRELETVRTLIAAGAAQIGISSGVSIVEKLLAAQRLENNY